MNKKIWPSARKVLPIFQIFCSVGVHFAQTVVHFANFQNQARKSGVLGLGWGCFVFVLIPEGVCDCWVKNRGWGWYSGQNETPSGQNETILKKKMGKNALEFGGGGGNSIIIALHTGVFFEMISFNLLLAIQWLGKVFNTPKVLLKNLFC